MKTYGATGNGVQDDTSAFQSAINAVCSNGGGQLYIPTGLFKISNTLSVGATVNGQNTQLPVSAAMLSVRDLKITPQVSQSATSWTFQFTQGCVQGSIFDRVMINSLTLSVGGRIQMLNAPGQTNVDTIWIRDCVIGHVVGTGISGAAGSSIMIIGGRINGTGATGSSTGIHLTGNNGVQIIATDVILHQTGVLIDDTIGLGSNREVFITHATLDPCYTGLMINHSSYVSVAGCWTESCWRENILADLVPPACN